VITSTFVNDDNDEVSISDGHKYFEWDCMSNYRKYSRLFTGGLWLHSVVNDTKYSKRFTGRFWLHSVVNDTNDILEIFKYFSISFGRHSNHYCQVFHLGSPKARLFLKAGWKFNIVCWAWCSFTKAQLAIHFQGSYQTFSATLEVPQTRLLLCITLTSISCLKIVLLLQNGCRVGL
jgi:hypothetical protein